MTRKRVFIAHAAPDRRWVPLLAKLIEMHGDEAWFATDDLRTGDRYREKLGDKLEGSDAMVLVASRRTPSSGDVTAEIGSFRESRPHAPVIPLVVDDLPPSELTSIEPGLSELHAVRCDRDVLVGFTRLFSALGRDFLSQGELSNRRSGGDRRDADDRRVASVEQRMSVGMLVNYTRHTGNSVSESSFVSPGDLEMYRVHVLGELSRYAYRRDGTEVDAAQVLDDAFAQARRLVARGVQQDAVELLRTLSRYVCDRYDVTMGDRRSGQRRR